MKNNDFFRPNWRAINKAIETDLKGLRLVQKELERTIQKKVDKYLTDKKQFEMNEKIKRLKSIPVNGTVYYIGNTPELIGKQGIVKVHGRTKCVVLFGILRYGCYYKNLSDIPLTSDEIINKNISIKVHNKLMGIVNKVK